MRAKIGNRLKEAIHEKLTDKDRTITSEIRWCAEKLGVDPSTVWDWYANRRQPSGLSVPRLAKLYRMNTEKFYYEI